MTTIFVWFAKYLTRLTFCNQCLFLKKRSFEALPSIRCTYIQFLYCFSFNGHIFWRSAAVECNQSVVKRFNITDKSNLQTNQRRRHITGQSMREADIFLYFALKSNIQTMCGRKRRKESILLTLYSYPVVKRCLYLSQFPYARQ